MSVNQIISITPQFGNLTNLTNLDMSVNKIISIRNKIDSGLSFENAAVEFSEDPSAQDNQGSLGYFTAFQMIYEFENYAFNTPVGKISKVFRTEFRYHIVKVMDKRLSKGEMLVRQIKIEMNPNPSQEEVLEAEAKINEVYKKLQSGEKFVSLVPFVVKNPKHHERRPSL